MKAWNSTMKISDPLGKVYTHTMFKKRSSYDMKSKDPKYAKQSSEISEDEEDLEEDMEMEHEDHNSEISDQSDDSLSTKSSKLAEQHQQRQHPSAHVQSSSSSHHLNHLHGSRREPRMSVVSYTLFLPRTLPPTCLWKMAALKARCMNILQLRNSFIFRVRNGFEKKHLRCFDAFLQ